MRRTAASGALASVLVAAACLTPLDAAASGPPPGACSVVSGSGPTVRQLPWPQQALDPDRAWPFSRGAGVAVAVIDSGVDSSHPQLSRPGQVLTGFDFLRDQPGADFDCVSHGTAVASIIAGDPIPGVGFHGIAPDAQLLPVRVTDAEAGAGAEGDAVDPHTFARAIRYAADNGASVINLSVVLFADDPAVRAAIGYAEAKDVVIVAAVGNQHQPDGPDPIPYPAAYPGVVGVGATTIDGTRLDASQIGNYVDITAPGGGVLAATRIRGQVFWDGTSFATPFVSGTVALVRAAYPKLTASQVVERVLATADPAPGGASGPAYGRGVVNPYRAVTDVLTAGATAPRPAPVTTPQPDVAAEHRAAVARARATRADHTVLGLAGAAAAAALVLVVAVSGRRRRWAPGVRALSR
jgi:type VII secretion-associated serine protease mycosin